MNDGFHLRLSISCRLTVGQQLTDTLPTSLTNGRGSWVVGRGSWVVGRGYKSWVVGVGVGVGVSNIAK